MRTLLVLLPLLAQAAAVETRRHVEEITSSKSDYRITQGGTMDGENCRSPGNGGFGIWTQTFESNRQVRLENVCDTDVIDPWLSNGRNDFRTMKEIVASAVRPGMTDRERAMAIWRQQTTRRFHAGAGDPAEMHDPVKVLNVYGYTTCGDDSICLAGLWHAAGFQVSPGRLLGHRTSEVFYDGRWHLMDGDLGPVYLLRDNATVACEEDLVSDHDLVKRSHPYGILDPDRRTENESHAALFCVDGKAAADPAIAGIVRESTMSMVLRPGEAIVWRWGHGSSVKYHGPDDIAMFGPRKDGGTTWGAAASDRICNGLWEYRPDFAREAWRKGAESAENLVVDRGSLAGGSIVWRMKSPYVFVGGRLEVVGAGARFFVSWDGSTWEPAGENLDSFFPPRGAARYEYRLKCDLPAGARLERLGIVNDLQMAPLALPGMVVGENRFTYTDRSPGGRKVRVTHEWIERSDLQPPAAPSAALSPIDGGRTERTDPLFRWRGVEGAEEYHVELSDRADFAWPLSSNFEKLLRAAGESWQPSSVGLLSPGRTYHWRVRARSAKGVWGPWSRTWTFTAGGPAVPLEVRIEGGVLRWTAGGKASRYRVYGSDERGFTVSDKPHSIVAGRSTEIPKEMPANVVAETEKTELAVLGPGLSNRAFYRVVALDEGGARSGPSDAASAPRPFFTREPSTSARRGVEYRDQVSVIRSLGDLRFQWVDGQEVASFWDIERPRYALEKAPSWLRMDERTGELTGVPDAAGSFEVSVTATLERSIRRLEANGPYPWNLGLGKEKTAAIVAENAGTAVCRFRITVGN